VKKLISAASFLLLFAIAPTAAAVDPKWGEIEIVRDKWGVPNVFSSTDAGAMYGLGYAQAEDRAFQMYYSLRIIQGRTAEVLGNVTKLNGRETSQDHDKRFRTIGYYRAAKEVARNLDPETRELLEAFSRGVNDSLQENRDRLVYLFDSLGLQPEPWTPADCIASWWHMAQFFAGDGLNDLANLHRFSAPASGPGRGGRGDRGDRGAPAPNAARIVDDAAAVVQEKDVDKEWVREIEEFVKRYGLKPQRTRSAGAPKFSHAWVVGGRKSTTGAPVLVSDPQTPVRNPSLWCEFHIQGKTFNVRGIGVAGSPIILIGFSEHVAWGVTALGADQSDLFVLKTDPAHPDSYFFDGEWRRMQVREETIRVKGGRSEKIIVRELANRVDGRYEVQLPVAENEKQFLLKADHDFNESHRLAFNYLIGTSYQPNPLLGNLPYGTQVFDGRQQNIGLTETWTHSPQLLNSLRLGYLRVVGQRFISPEVSLKDFGGNFETDGFDFPPELNIVGYMQMRTRFLGPTFDNSYQILDTVNWLKGRHNFKFGGEVIHNRGANYSGLWSNGWFDFNGAFTGNALADFFIGRSSNLTISSVNRAISHSSYYGLFVQDDFRVTPRLTLNLGLRYEIFTPAIEPHNRMSTYIPGHQSTTIPGAPPGLAFHGEPGVPSKLRNYDKDNFGPRVGLAWDVFGDGRASIRAGYGLYYSASTLNAQSTSTPPYQFQNFYFGAPLSDPWAANNGVALLPFRFDPANPIFFFPVSITSVDQNWHEPNFHQFNLTVQKQLGETYMIEVGYFGNLGRDLRTQVDINEPVFIPGQSTPSNVQSRRPIFPEFYGQIARNINQDFTDYHSMQIAVKKRFSSGLSFDASYVLSKSTDLGSGLPVSNYQWDLEHGRSSLDRRHRFIASFIVEPMWARNLSGVARYILDGWQASGILEFQSGAPLNITAGRDINLNGTNTDRPHLNGDPKLDPNRSRAEVANRWFDTSVFSQPATGEFGTAGRNILDGPGFKGLDLGLSRNFRFHGQRLQFRGELFNAFNWVNLNAPNTNASAGNFGRILTAGSPRVIQLGLKLFLNSEE